VATVSITTMPEITIGVGVPRAAHVRFPLGTPFGEPGEHDVHRAILEDALSLIWEATDPGTVVKLPYRWRRGLPAGR
jgi:D-proline reductase (dithiol) PrdB